MSTRSILTHDIAVKAYKTFVEVTAAQAALYGTVIPDPPGVKPAATISLVATLLAVLWNAALLWFSKAKSAKLDALAAAIDKIVDERLDQQHVPDAATPSLSPTVVAPPS